MLITTAKDEQLKYVKETRINELLEDLLCFYLINGNTLDGVQRIKYVFCLFKHIQSFHLLIHFCCQLNSLIVSKLSQLEIYSNWKSKTNISKTGHV